MSISYEDAVRELHGELSQAVRSGGELKGEMVADVVDGWFSEIGMPLPDANPEPGAYWVPEHLARKIAGIFGTELFDGVVFDCQGAEAVAELLRCLGSAEGADTLLYSHSLSDEEGDQHYRES